MNEAVSPSAGHHLKDPGAVNSSGVKEADKTIELRDLVIKAIERFSPTTKIISDKDTETNTQYQNRLKLVKNNIIFDIHFNAAASELANGTEVVISANAGQASKDIAKEILEGTCRILGTRNRGILKDTETPRGKIGILNLAGPAVLLEICFISNKDDMAKYELHKRDLAFFIACTLTHYDKKLNP